jgi:hypothetical protein
VDGNALAGVEGFPAAERAARGGMERFPAEGSWAGNGEPFAVPCPAFPSPRNPEA